jgi:hypothetical protein
MGRAGFDCVCEQKTQPFTEAGNDRADSPLRVRLGQAEDALINRGDPGQKVIFFATDGT